MVSGQYAVVNAQCAVVSVASLASCVITEMSGGQPDTCPGLGDSVTVAGTVQYAL